MGKERNLYLDILKSICIILVIVGHCIQYGAGSDNLIYGGFLYNPLFIFIYSFHMPLFMLISGYLFSYSCKNKDFKECLYAKSKQLLIPLFAWSFITLLIQILKVILGVSKQNITLIWMGQSIISGFMYGPWFLWALWWSSLLVILVRRFLNDNIFVYLAICLLAFIIPDIDNSAVYKFMFPFFVLAYLFNEYDYKDKLKHIYQNKFFVISCFVVFSFLLSFYNFNSYIYTSGYTLINKDILMQIHNNLFRFFIGLIGSISIMYLVYSLVCVSPNWLNKGLAYIGKCTLGIYLISNYFFDEILKFIPFQGINYWYILIESICILMISLFLTLIIKKFKITNRLFLGGR